MKRYKYVGKERDEETGLYYYGARYYSAWLGRFVSVDPLAGKFPFYTPYQYSGNNPMTFYDLDGRETAINDTTKVNPNGPQGTQGGEIAFIDKFSGKYLGSYSTDSTNGFSIRSINKSDFDILKGNDFKDTDLGFMTLSIEEHSKEVNIDNEKILSDINTVSQKDEKMMDKLTLQQNERNLYFIFDRNNNSITTKIIDNKENTATKAVNPYNKRPDTHSTTVDSVDEIIIGQLHTHVPDSIMTMDAQNKNLASNPGVKGPGVSEDDIITAKKLLVPVYALATYKINNEKNNIYKVDAYGKGSDSKEAITNLKMVNAKMFNLIGDVIKSNIPKNRVR